MQDDEASWQVGPSTRVSEILDRYGDIAEVMELFGVRRVGPLSIRRVLAKLLTVERAAWVHRVPLDAFMAKLNTAIARVGAREASR